MYWDQQALPSKTLESEYTSVPSGLQSFPVYTVSSLLYSADQQNIFIGTKRTSWNNIFKNSYVLLH